MFQLNSQVFTEAKAQLQQEGFCRVNGVLSGEQADLLFNELRNIQYKIAFTQDGKPQALSQEQLGAMAPAQRQSLFDNIQQHAARGVGFVYGRHFINDQSTRTLRTFSEHLNSQKILNTFSDISGQKIIRASAQATCYDKGYFLTRHNDVVPSEGRVYAYVLGLTPQWHPDWGGLLQFYRQDGSPTHSYAPIYNSLTIFDVHKIHAVTYVAPYAAAKRYSVTGWFRTI
ncbi:2OG-Fe(II) oxygenase [Shewanella insulae]|uniref:2OG-Fe(II) oxygenase n=1 Tax=Shewanella insulae TaxID=2681496 RepID=UPI001EFDD312|nr:2OG-Fe(II) oxygenase family protein [Shewanella insulae]MCG9712902.1 2OG-Fe(II) oxygenase [Shewanella insulae]MCG9755450.1 2OG-Fe(II) oxygenase [Shewanella insulae]